MLVEAITSYLSANTQFYHDLHSVPTRCLRFIAEFKLMSGTILIFCILRQILKVFQLLMAVSTTNSSKQMKPSFVIVNEKGVHSRSLKQTIVVMRNRKALKAFLMPNKIFDLLEFIYDVLE